ncbi:MAG: GNAT family N-acetyltransferase [Anaerolineales bacterium]
MPVQRFEADTIGGLDWPATPDGDYARRWLLPFMQNGPLAYIANAHASVQVLKLGEALLPITLSDFHPANSYVCSPYTHYVSYAREEFRHLRNPPVERLLRLLFGPLGGYLRAAQLDRVVYVNNWLLSTNLYPALNAEQVRGALEHLRAAFPDRAIVFRSVEAAHYPAVDAALAAAGCRRVFSRSIYFQDPASAQVQRKLDYQRDLKLLADGAYTVVDGAELGPDDAARILELYNLLYLRKYSYYNPQFTEAFIKLALADRLLTIKVLRRDGGRDEGGHGVIDGALGYVARGGLMTAPLFGYDTGLPQALALYRRLSALVAQEGLRRQLEVHLSAGVGGFKRARGGRPALEYNLVYDAHLPANRRRAWALVQALTERIAVPVIVRRGF